MLSDQSTLLIVKKMIPDVSCIWTRRAMNELYKSGGSIALAFLILGELYLHIFPCWDQYTMLEMLLQIAVT